jgi:hypothetical protein
MKSCNPFIRGRESIYEGILTAAGRGAARLTLAVFILLGLMLGTSVAI